MPSFKYLISINKRYTITLSAHDSKFNCKSGEYLFYYSDSNHFIADIRYWIFLKITRLDYETDKYR